MIPFGLCVVQLRVVNNEGLLSQLQLVFISVLSLMYWRVTVDDRINYFAV